MGRKVRSTSASKAQDLVPIQQRRFEKINLQPAHLGFQNHKLAAKSPRIPICPLYWKTQCRARLRCSQVQPSCPVWGSFEAPKLSICQVTRPPALIVWVPEKRSKQSHFWVTGHSVFQFLNQTAISHKQSLRTARGLLTLTPTRTNKLRRSIKTHKIAIFGRP